MKAAPMESPVRKAGSTSSFKVLGLALAILGGAPVAESQAGVFKPGEVGTYTGDGIVRSILYGVPRAPERAGARIRVRGNSLILDGVHFRLANGKIRGRYYYSGLSMSLEGTYRKIGSRLLAEGGLEIFNLSSGATVDANWDFNLRADGKRATYILGIRIPDAMNPGSNLAVINARASGTLLP